MTRSSTYSGRSGGRASRVTPPISMPVSARVSSAVANDTRGTSRRRRTTWFTSSRVVASTRQAQYFLGSFFEATMIVLPEWSRATPYFSQNAAVSANSGSMRISSHGAPRPSRAWATRASMTASSLMGAWTRTGPSSGSDLDETGVVRGCPRRRRAIFREHVGAAARVLTRGIGREPGAFLDGHDTARDAFGDVRREDGGAAIVEHAYALAIDDAAGGGVRGMDPHVLPVRAGENGLVVVGRVRARPRLGGDQLQRMLGIARVRGNPRGNGRDLPEAVEVGLGRKGGRVDLDLPRRRRERVPLRIPHFLGEGYRIIGGGEPRQPMLTEGIEVVDVGVLAHLAQPLQIRRALVALETQTLGQIGADVHVVAAPVHGRDGLLHEDHVVAGPAPGRVHVAPLPERGGGQHDVRVAGRWRQEVIVGDHELELAEPGRDLVDVRALVREVATRRVHQLDVRRVAAGAPALEQVREQRGGDAGVGGIRGCSLALDALKTGAIAAPGVAARNADVARDGAQRVGGAVELLAVRRAPRRIAAVERSGLEGGELAREPPDGGGGNAGERLRPLRSLHDAVREAEEIGAIRRAGRRAGGQMPLVEPQHEAVEEGLVVEILAHDDLGHGDQHSGVRARSDGHVLVGQLVARPGGARIDGDDPYPALVRPVEILRIVRAEGPVTRAPAPEDHETRVDVVRGLATRGFGFGRGTIRVAE